MLSSKIVFRISATMKMFGYSINMCQDIGDKCPELTWCRHHCQILHRISGVSISPEPWAYPSHVFSPVNKTIRTWCFLYRQSYLECYLSVIIIYLSFICLLFVYVNDLRCRILKTLIIHIQSRRYINMALKTYISV